MGRTSRAPEQGFTVIELLIGVSIAALLLVFGVPAVSQAINPSELEQAVRITEDTVQQARRTARVYRTEVTMEIESDISQKAIRLKVPKMQKNPALSEVGETVPLPEGVDIFSSDTVIRFGPNGEVEWPTTVLLVSQQSSQVSTPVLIQ